MSSTNYCTYPASVVTLLYAAAAFLIIVHLFRQQYDEYMRVRWVLIVGLAVLFIAYLVFLYFHRNELRNPPLMINEHSMHIANIIDIFLPFAIFVGLILFTALLRRPPKPLKAATSIAKCSVVLWTVLTVIMICKAVLWSVVCLAANGINMNILMIAFKAMLLTASAVAMILQMSFSIPQSTFMRLRKLFISVGVVLTISSTALFIVAVCDTMGSLQNSEWFSLLLTFAHALIFFVASLVIKPRESKAEDICEEEV